MPRFDSPKFLKLRRLASAACFAVIVQLISSNTSASAAETVWLSSLDITKIEQGWGKPHVDKSVDGHAISIGGKTFERGIGTHAESVFRIDLKKSAEKFSASAGVDDDAPQKVGSVEFQVFGDGKLLWKSGVLKSGDAPKLVELDVKGVGTLMLMVTDAGDGNNSDHADWADAQLQVVSGAQPEAISRPREQAVILTPKPPAAPRITGAKVFGVRPGSPFLFAITATGERPMEFAADDLPDGLKLDAATGRITGALGEKGEHVITVRAKNSSGTGERKLRVVVGDQIALTPPMGWNSWNCFAHAVSEDRVKRAADALVKSGLVNHGWSYINIDDFWQNHRDSKDPTLRGEFRDAQGNIVPNSRFPDMKGLADYIHSLGLKAGLYSSPGPWTCGGCTGSFEHEQQDAETYAKWGFDYLKYDWCSYKPEMEQRRGKAVNFPADVKSWGGYMPPSTEVAQLIKPYAMMGRFLREQPRDIVFSLCQYGMGDVWKWGASVSGNCWRATGDITDTWGSMSGIGFNQDKAAPCAGPGHWNDPDMLIVGQVGWGHLHPTRLTPNEQYTHISLWCLLAAPLLIGCDLDALDDFTLNLLTNDEVLDVDQDPLGKQAVRVAKQGDVEVYAKELEDGSHAVGLFNRGLAETNATVSWTDLGLSGKQTVRDLWQQKDLGVFEEKFETKVVPHGVVLARLTPAR
jgi:alpha-galactosidase